jgi:hypothetical protein
MSNYASLKRLSTPNTKLYIGNEWAAHSLKHPDAAKMIVISALPPKKAEATHLIEFDDKEGKECVNDIKHAKKCIMLGCQKLAAAMNAKRPAGTVLVHCWMGRNRSAAIIVAYAMKHLRWSFKKSINYLRREVKKQRGFTGVLQNRKFQAILKEIQVP